MAIIIKSESFMQFLISVEIFKDIFSFFKYAVTSFDKSKILISLAKKGILLRQMDVYSIKNSLRVTIGNNKENLKLMSELKKILNV